MNVQEYVKAGAQRKVAHATAHTIENWKALK